MKVTAKPPRARTMIAAAAIAAAGAAGLSRTAGADEIALGKVTYRKLEPVDVIIPPDQGSASKTNNPGNLREAGQRGAKRAKNGMAIFPTPEAGWVALHRQLDLYDQRDKMNLRQAIYTYAPPNENDTEAYLAFVLQRLKLPGTTKLADVNLDEMAKAMIWYESHSVVVARPPAKGPNQLRIAEMARQAPKTASPWVGDRFDPQQSTENDVLQRQVESLVRSIRALQQLRSTASLELPGGEQVKNEEALLSAAVAPKEAGQGLAQENQVLRSHVEALESLHETMLDDVREAERNIAPPA